MVPSRIELLILALLAPRLNQLGQGTSFVVGLENEIPMTGDDIDTDAFFRIHIDKDAGYP